MRCRVCQKVTLYGGRVTFGTTRWCFKVLFPREQHFEIGKNLRIGLLTGCDRKNLASSTKTTRGVTP